MACIEAGADGAWLSVRTAEKIDKLREVSGRPMFGVLPRAMTLKQYQSAGASCAVIPGALQVAGLCNQRSLLEAIKHTGNYIDFLNGLDHIDEIQKFYSDQGNEELRRSEKDYGGEQ